VKHDPRSLNFIRRVAAAEQARMLELALETNSDDVKKFGILMLARIAVIAEGEAEPDAMEQSDIDGLVDLQHQLESRGIHLVTPSDLGDDL